MERTILLTQGELQIPCRLIEPDYGDITRVIIGIHGFCGDKDSTVLGAVAEEMSFYRTAMVCFDLPAHGTSPMSDRALTIPNCCGSLLAVAEFVKESYPGAEEFCLFATSFGSYVTLLVLDELMDCLGHIKLAFRAPAVRMAETFLGISGLTEEELLKKGRVTCGFDRKIEIPYSFYQELKFNPAFNSYSVPMMILQGDQDDVVSPQDVQHFRRLNEQAQLVMFPGTDHRFKKEGELDRIIDLTRDWFLCEQVLLSDWS